jgi:hypothetical protein
MIVCLLAAPGIGVGHLFDMPVSPESWFWGLNMETGMRSSIWLPIGWSTHDRRICPMMRSLCPFPSISLGW